MSKRNAEVVDLLVNHPDIRLEEGGWGASAFDRLRRLVAVKVALGLGCRGWGIVPTSPPESSACLSLCLLWLGCEHPDVSVNEGEVVVLRLPCWLVENGPSLFDGNKAPGVRKSWRARSSCETPAR